MKKQGFTLIELLAVIVILAIIALITIPAVMKMIDNATMNSYRRSVDLYGKAVGQAIISYQTDMVEKSQSTNVTFDNIEPYIEYEGNEVDCKIKQIYSDKTILLTECYIDEELVLAEKNRGYSDENYYYYTNSKKKMKAIEYIKAVEEALQGKNISGTCTVSEDKITCNGEEITIKSNLENANSGTLEVVNSKVVSYNGLKFATEKKSETNQEVPQIIDEQITPGDNNQSNNAQEDLATGEDYRGYYADVDGNGTVDGVIYADLAHASGTNAKWGPGYNGAYASDGEYSYEALEDLKEYTISENKYTEGKFGEKEIITLKPGSSGNSRFYVMALNDFTTEAYTDPNDSNNNYPAYTTYYWYYNASAKMPYPVKDTSTDFGTGYTNTGTMIRIWNNNGAETGWTTGATQDKRDIWKHIQEKYNSKEKWYIPSLGEWAAFADYFGITSNCDTGSCVANSGNYNSTYGLSVWYWSSSQRSTYSSWDVRFRYGDVYDIDVRSSGYVRLGATF